METLKTKKSKFLVMLIVFMLLFSNFGYTIAAIATSGEFEVISKGFFQKDEVKFNSYFVDENGKQITEITENVNQKVKLVVEVLPQVEGYLKNATLRAVSEDDNDINFKFTSVTENLLKESQTSLNSALVKDDSNKVENNSENEAVENNDLVNSLVPVENESTEQSSEQTNENSNTVATENELLNSLVSEESNSQSINPLSTATTAMQGTSSEAQDESSNPLLDALTNSDVSNKIGVDSETSNNVEEPVDEEPAQIEEDKLVDEDAIIEEATKEARIEEEIRNAILDIKVVSENEISLSNIIEDTKFEIELEYNQGEKFDVSDLYKNIKLQLSGTYINRNLEEIQVGKENDITVGWEYTKDITLESEYTKFSPFELEDIRGTIVENKITITRDVQDEKYLPIKSTRLEVVAPKVNGKNPIDADVIANKLLATKGQDYGQVVFEEKNWKYDSANGTINVFVENDDNVYSMGTDEYVIIYRYEDYIDSESSNLSNNIKATVTEYSGKENNTIIKEIKDSQDVKVDVDELVTYNIGTNEEKINKGKIYANYNSETPLYETLFANQVNVNILTSDVLEQLKIDCSKDIYKDIVGTEYEAQGIEYKEIKFNYLEISSILSEGGEIVITNVTDEPIYVLNRDDITNESDCIVNLNGVNGIHIYANNVAKNGTINFELTKAIKKCNYDKSVFKTISQIESRISADVKYTNIEERIALQTLVATKDFEESQTSATLSINRDSLSTLRTNDNVELKIQLNNDKETSDLYINPSFEVVFPKYVTAVGIESINLLNDCGLRVADFETYTENDIVKVRIELSGTQTMFSENTSTNGTNIIINANIEVDEYAPAKQDQIKLYYCNEGVATYQSQTSWAIKKKVPNGILKTTNGFDIESIKYQAPVGLIAINGIVNYDGNLGEVRSVKQGEVSKQIPINAPSRIATMELLALNNTENTCTDVVLIGRTPFKGNTDLISNEDLGTTTDVRLVDAIKEDAKNTNTSKIYYSSNPNATRDLNSNANGWTQDVQDLSSVKSYMIVIEGELAAGSTVRYTYDFEIPENLPYEAKILGTFGSFYNNMKQEAVVFETTTADNVVLETENGPKIEAKLSVDIGDGNEVGERRFLKYTLKVNNIGSIEAENVTINNPVPSNSLLYVYDTSDLGLGNNNYVEAKNQTGLSWNIDSLKAGETVEYTYIVKVNRLREGEDSTVKSKATVNAANLGITLDSNETSNQIVKSNLDLQINTDTLGEITVGRNLQFKVKAVNIAEKTLENVIAECKIPKEFSYKNIDIMCDENSSYDENSISFDENNNTVRFNIDKLDQEGFFSIKVEVVVSTANKDIVSTYMSFYMDENVEEKTSNCDLNVIGPELSVKQVTNAEYVLEGENVEFAIEIENKGTDEATGLRITDEISEYLENVRAAYTGSASSKLSIKDGKIEQGIASLTEGGKIVLTISGIAKDLPDGVKENKISNVATITGDYIEPITTNISEVVIQENPNKVDDSNNSNDNNNNNDNNNDNDNNDDSDSNNNNNNDNINDNNNDINNNDNINDNNDISNNDSNNNSNDNSNNNNNNNSNNNVNNNNNNNTNNNNQVNNNTNSSTNNSTSNDINQKIYSISGKAWLDTNYNGKNDSDETSVSTIKVQLLKDNKMLQATTTDGNGKYEFKELEPGNYNVVFLYDSETYTPTVYKKAEVSDDTNSDAIETEAGRAITDNLTITDTNLVDIDMGLRLKDTFDLSIGKYLSKATVKTVSSENEYNFNDESISKIEIRAKEIQDAVVKLEYKFVIENVGLAEGNALKVVDQMPDGMTFDEKSNTGWYLGSDGNLYNETLKDKSINPGEKVELRLVLEKQMNEENTGVSNNKAVLLETQNASGLKDNSENNVSTQQVFIMIGTSGRTKAIIGTIIAIILAFVLYQNRERVKTAFSKRYRNDSNKKIKTKKIYK